MPQPTVTITRNHSDSILAGTGLVLTANISFSNQSRINANVNKALDILWRRGNNAIIGDTCINISAVSGSGDSYAASLTYSPITISDSGQITAIVTVRPETVNEYI